MGRVGIIGIGHGRFGRRSDATVQELAFEAFRMAMQDAGIERGVLDASVIAAVPEYHKQRSVAGVVNETVRQIGGELLAGRYGGEEFAVILPDTSLDKAVSLCERFRERVRDFEFTFQDLSLQITTSVGVAAQPPGGDISGEQLVALADKALYQAKSQGRNRVVAI